MKKITAVTLRIVQSISLDAVLAILPPSFGFLKKLIPHPSFYKKSDEVIIKRDNTSFNVNRSDWMQWHIYANLPDDSWKFALKMLQPEKKALIILDIGSNIGAFSFKLASNLRKKGIENFTIHSFDPNPYIQRRFEKNMGLNPSLQNNIKFHTLAVSDFCGTTSFDFTEDNSGGGSIQGKGIPIEVITIDEFCTAKKINRLNFIKIDVEGFEPFVFDGGRKTIEKYKPTIYTEISPPLYEAKGRSERDIFRYLIDTGYSLYKDQGNGLQRIDSIASDPTLKRSSFNILAIFEGTQLI